MITEYTLCIESPAGDPGHWLIDESVDFLNHGSFGACPRPVLDAQTRYREEMEREPVRFMTVLLPDEPESDRMDFTTSPSPSLPLYTRLLRDHGIDVPVSAWPALPRQTLRISAQAYNHLGQFERVAEILKQQFNRTA